jgi:hypothetical protein
VSPLHQLHQLQGAIHGWGCLLLGGRKENQAKALDLKPGIRCTAVKPSAGHSPITTTARPVSIV